MKLKIVLVILGVSSVASAENLRVNNSTNTRLGIGMGWQAESLGSRLAPSRGAVRIRFPSGWAIEPSLGYSQVKGDRLFASESKSLNLQTRIRMPLAKRDDLALSAIGSVEASVLDELSEAWTFSTGWGISVEWFAGDHWSLTMDAISPVYSVNGWKDERSQLIGPLLTPQYSAMATLYF